MTVLTLSSFGSELNLQTVASTCLHIAVQNKIQFTSIILPSGESGSEILTHITHTNNQLSKVSPEIHSRSPASIWQHYTQNIANQTLDPTCHRLATSVARRPSICAVWPSRVVKYFAGRHFAHWKRWRQPLFCASGRSYCRKSVLNKCLKL